MKSTPEKIGVICPNCGKHQEIIWFAGFTQTYQVTGSTGKASHRVDHKQEKVEGTCECGYKFKPKDLDDA